jgi:TolA-binding protein
MGRKQGWTWKHIPLYVVGVIVSAVFACASTNALVTSSASSDASVSGSASSDASGTGQEIVSYLQRVQPLIRQGDYEGAMKESQEALSVSPKSPPGDEALFYMGLISVHYGNPKKDYQKALSFFRRVTKEFPLSPRAEESKIWIGVLEAIEKAKQVDIQIEEKKKELTK